MATSDIKIAIDSYFSSSWTSTSVQYQGQNLDASALSKFISVTFFPSGNSTYGLDGTASGRILYTGIYKVFCYAKNFNKALVLADEVKTFLNCKEFPESISIKIGQDGAVNDLGNGFIEVVCSFDVEQYSHFSQSEDYLINNYGITDDEGNFLTDEDGAYLLQDF